LIFTGFEVVLAALLFDFKHQKEPYLALGVGFIEGGIE
jgi:hypothetical protein